jgi:RNA polymerase sigma-70 factor (ECF subfamily)
MEPSDEELMQAWRGGDARAFEGLYARHKGALYRFVLRSVRRREEAEELYQEVWMRVIEAHRRYEPRARFATWLYTIAHHRLIDHWRRHEVHALSLDEDDPPLAEPAGNPGLEPQRQAEAREDLERLARAIAALPPAQREVFLLREEAGLSVPEIAIATGADAEAVKSRLRYAVDKLRKALGDD